MFKEILLDAMMDPNYLLWWWDDGINALPPFEEKQELLIQEGERQNLCYSRWSNFLEDNNGS